MPRIPLGVSLESRDGTLTKDARVYNGIVEQRGDQFDLRLRPGIDDLGLVNAGVAQLLYSWNGIQMVTGDVLSNGTISTIVSSPAQDTLMTTNDNLPMTAQETGNGAATALLMFKNRTQAWTVNRSGTVADVTFADNMGAATYAISSLTRVSNTATAVLATDPGFEVGDSVTVAGADQAAYNGAVTITAVTAGSSTPARDVPITSLTRSGTTATAVAVGHGLTTATAYVISGANESAYNGSKTITKIDADTFTYTVTVTSAAAITGTWNTSDKAAAVTLSGGNLTASSNPADSAFAGVRGTVSKSTGQWAFEVTVGSFPTDTYCYIGIANSTQTLTGDVDSNPTNAWIYRSAKAASGALKHGTTSISVASYTTGDKIGIAFDGDADTVSFYKNGAYQGAFTGITGTVYPFFSSYDGSGAGTSAVAVTANFAGAFTYNYDSPNSPATGSPIITDPAVTVNPSFSYAVAGNPATPATGTITVSTDGGTVPGIPYINGYFCVMDVNGVIWNSSIDDPTTWEALNFVTAQYEAGGGKALARSQSYLIAFKEWSTEFFYDRQDGATGSPFSPVDNGFTKIGCAAGYSVAEVDGQLAWVAQTRQQGRSVYMMDGLTQRKVSNPDVERVLNADNLLNVYSYGLKQDGHVLYVLGLPSSSLTLVYDVTANHWGVWSSLAVGSTVSVTSIVRDGEFATVTATAHGLEDGQPCKIAGADQAGYNGFFLASVTDDDTFSIKVSDATPTPATGTITVAPLTETYFKFTRYVNHEGSNLLLHESDGHLYQMVSQRKQDDGIPINLSTRTVRIDGGTLDRKRIGSIRVVGDPVNDYALMRWSDDDGVTWTKFRFVDLSSIRPELRRCGAFRRRVIEFKTIANAAVRVSALEFDIK